MSRCKNPLTLPTATSGAIGCGKCLYCRLQRRREWAIRLQHELEYYDEACFITLTYEVDPYSLIKADLQKFIKRLRKRYEPKKIRYYAVGEYGEKKFRPHYHLIVFGIIADEQSIGDLWGHGMVRVGSVTADSIRYVAGYIEKKLYGNAANVYNGRIPPFSLMSKKMGSKYFVDNIDKILEDNNVSYRGKKQQIPRYYLKMLKRIIGEDAYDEYRLQRSSDLEPIRVDKITKIVPYDLAPDDWTWREFNGYRDIILSRGRQSELSLNAQLKIKSEGRKL